MPVPPDPLPSAAPPSTARGARFVRFVLRTPDPAAASAFYAHVLGRAPRHVARLPPVLAARGVPPHWLGVLGVPDPDAAAREVVRRGGLRLGAAEPTGDGVALDLLRDPGGALVAVSRHDATALAPEPSPDPGDATDATDAATVTPVLVTRDLDGAAACYARLCDWHFAPAAHDPAAGRHRVFATPDGHLRGVAVDAAAHPGAHPHWLFHFAVPPHEGALDAALARVRAAGGRAYPPVPTPDGRRVAACEDAHGAAFGLVADD